MIGGPRGQKLLLTDILALLNGSDGIIYTASYPPSTRFDCTTTPDVSYFGFAEPGTLDSAVGWQVFKLDETTAVASKLYADGDSLFDNIWNDYLSLSYS